MTAGIHSVPDLQDLQSALRGLSYAFEMTAADVPLVLEWSARQKLDPQIGARIPRGEWQMRQGTAHYVHKPEEWVAYRSGEDMTLGRIFCPILIDDPPKDYVVWISERETSEISSSSLHRVLVSVPSGDGDAIDGDQHRRLPLLASPATPHVSNSGRIGGVNYPAHSPGHVEPAPHGDSSLTLSNPLNALKDLNAVSTRQPSRDNIEGDRWLRQAETDHLACGVLLDKVLRDSAGTYRSICCTVCFMAHEAAEKSLKAGRYVTCGVVEQQDLVHHKLSHHAYALASLQPKLAKDLVKHAKYLEPFYLMTRFPNQYPKPVVPYEKFTPEHASKAHQAAQQIQEIIRRIFEDSRSM